MEKDSIIAPALSFDFAGDTKLTLDAVHHRCDPKQGAEKTFLFVEYLMKVDGIMYTLETAPMDDLVLDGIQKYTTLEDFMARWPKFRVYPRNGHWSNYGTEEKSVDMRLE